MTQSLSFGPWLKEKRKSCGLTRLDLARLLLYSVATIRKVEAEERRPSRDLVERIAKIFNIPAIDFLIFYRFARGGLPYEGNKDQNDFPKGEDNFVYRSNIPTLLTSLVGRDQEILEILVYLDNRSIRLISLIGAPGVGKTRLALEVAHRVQSNYCHGVYFVPLTSIHDSSEIPSAILDVLRNVESDSATKQAHLSERIGKKQILLIMDNGERYVEACRSLLHTLLQDCPNLTILTTSTEALHLYGEWLYTVEPLLSPPADTPLSLEKCESYPSVKLFIERARSVCPGYRLNHDNYQHIAAICNRLDGLPLAIEIIAPTVRLSSLRSLLERLNPPTLNGKGIKAIPNYYHSLHRAILWSFERLTVEEQIGFAFLSVFLGGFQLEAAEAILSTILQGSSVFDIIKSLLDKSLIQRTVSLRGEVRFSMLETIRFFASQRLEKLDRESEGKNIHLKYYVEFAEDGASKLHGAEQAEWAEILEDEYHNFRQAIFWGVQSKQIELVLRLLCALGWAWEFQGHYHEARFWLSKIQPLIGEARLQQWFARFLNHIGRHYWTQGDLVSAVVILRESEEILKSLGVEAETDLAETYNWLGLALNSSEMGVSSACDLITQGYEIFSVHHDERGKALSEFHLGINQNSAGDRCGSISRYKVALAYYRRQNDYFYIARVSSFLGNVYLGEKNYDMAYYYFLQRLILDEKNKFWNGMAEGWRDLGNVYLMWECQDLARICYHNSIQICLEYGLNCGWGENIWQT